MKTVMIVCGTRPEAIKLAPLVNRLKSNSEFKVILCSTGQHKEMLDQVFSLFGLKPDIELAVMRPNQDLTEVTCAILSGLNIQFSNTKPDLVLVHGDTNTTLSTAISSYYHKIPIHHVEAGLRTGDLYSPWPEEGNRKLTAMLCKKHYAPTQQSMDNLVAEGVDPKSILVTGNTVIDSLIEITKRLDNDKSLLAEVMSQLPTLKEGKKLLLVTGHRRENFGEGMDNICVAIKTLATRNDLQIIYPVHLNPNVREPVEQHLGEVENVHLLSTLDYSQFAYLLSKCHVVLTDSGGIQEEAPALGKPVLVMRDTTERPEAIQAGTALLVGTQHETITNEVSKLLDNESHWKKMSQASNPYGDGNACERIVEDLLA